MSDVVSYRGLTGIYIEETGNWNVHHDGTRIGYCRGLIGNSNFLFFQCNNGMSVKVMRVTANMVQKISEYANAKELIGP